jgi:hypothetical protein
LRLGISKYPGSLALADCDNGAELKDTLRLVLLLVDRKDGVRADLIEERRSGTTTTGMLPLVQMSRLDFALSDVLVVTVELRLSCFRLKMPEDL